MPKSLRWILGGLLCIGAILLFIYNYTLAAALCLIVGLGVTPMPRPKLPYHMEKEERNDKENDKRRKG